MSSYEEFRDAIQKAMRAAARPADVDRSQNQRQASPVVPKQPMGASVRKRHWSGATEGCPRDHSLAPKMTICLK